METAVEGQPLLLSYSGLSLHRHDLGVGLFDRLDNPGDKLRRVVPCLTRIFALLGDRLLVEIVPQRVEVQRAGMAMCAGEQDIVRRDTRLLLDLPRARWETSSDSPMRSQNTSAARVSPCRRTRALAWSGLRTPVLRRSLK